MDIKNIALPEEFKSFLASKNIYSRKNKTGHITGSAWIISRDFKSVLLTHHKKLNIWIQTGGHSEGETNAFDISKREGEEESGLILKEFNKEVFYIDIHDIPDFKNVQKHKHFDITYIFYPQIDQEIQISEESLDLRWIELDKIEEYTTENNILEMRDKTLNLIKSGVLTIL